MTCISYDPVIQILDIPHKETLIHKMTRCLQHYFGRKKSKTALISINVKWVSILWHTIVI